MSVRKTSVEIDEDLLTAVRRVLSTATLKETIEQAFREVLRAQARREEVEALSTMPEAQRKEILTRSEAHKVNPQEATPLEESIERIRRSL